MIRRREGYVTFLFILLIHSNVSRAIDWIHLDFNKLMYTLRFFRVLVVGYQQVVVWV